MNRMVAKKYIPCFPLPICSYTGLKMVYTGFKFQLFISNSIFIMGENINFAAGTISNIH